MLENQDRMLRVRESEMGFKRKIEKKTVTDVRSEDIKRQLTN